MAGHSFARWRRRVLSPVPLNWPFVHTSPRRPTMKRFAIWCAILVLVQNSVHAWHDRGHKAVARIAWQRLVEQGRDHQAIQILQAHPHRDVYLKHGRPDG